VWRELLRHDPVERQFVRLIGEEHYEVWVIGWTRDQRVGLHDHGGSTGAFLVVEGQLTEINLAGRTRRLKPGAVVQMDRHVVHDVVNLHDPPAASIHVYSPPLTSMTHYDAVTGQPIGTVSVELETPWLTAWPPDLQSSPLQ
jgi:quercetin dioxygenase-like cupin family protein